MENCGKFVVPKGISSVIVEKGTPGLSFGKKERKVCLSMSINGWFLNQREVHHSVSIKINLGLFLWDRVPNKLKQMNETVQSAVIRWNSTTVIGASFRSGPLCGPLLHRSPAVVFFDCQHPDFWDFSSALPVDIVRVKS